MFPEDFLYPGSTLYISEEETNPFLISLQRLLTTFCNVFNLQLEAISIDDEHIWLRDYFVHFANKNNKIKHLIPMEKDKYYETATQNSIKSILEQEAKKYFFHGFFQKNIVSTVGNIERPGSELACKLLQKANTTEHEIKKQNNKLAELARHAHIEGGNIFSVYNTQKEPYLLIGELSLLWTAAQRNYPAPFEQNKIKNIIAETLSFNSDSIIVLPQNNYHIDLQIGYLGAGRVILNDYSLCIRVIEEMLIKPETSLSPNELSAICRIISLCESGRFFPKSFLDSRTVLLNMLAITQKLNDLFESQIEIIFTKLTEQKFTVIRVPGVFYYPSETLEGTKLISIAQFMNGLGGEDLNKEAYFMTANSSIHYLKNIFLTYLSNFEIKDVHFLGEPVKTSIFITETEGSLRCLTTTHLKSPANVSSIEVKNNLRM